MFEMLRNTDIEVHGESSLRKCFKLTKAHTDPTSFQKMSVKLAAQVLQIGFLKIYSSNPKNSAFFK